MAGGNGDEEPCCPVDDCRRVRAHAECRIRARLLVLLAGLRFRRRRLQLLELSAMPGERRGAHGLVRSQPRLPPCQRPATGRSPQGQPKETLMRLPAFATLAAGTLLAASPASAQTYGAGYPVCLHVYG